MDFFFHLVFPGILIERIPCVKDILISSPCSHVVHVLEEEGDN